jgi:hypothetical protein
MVHFSLLGDKSIYESNLPHFKKDAQKDLGYKSLFYWANLLLFHWKNSFNSLKKVAIWVKYLTRLYIWFKNFIFCLYNFIFFHRRHLYRRKRRK